MYYYTEDDDRVFAAQLEAKRLTEDKDRVILELQDKLKIARAEAIKEFAERLLELFPSDRVFTTISRSTISRLAKEMVGEQ